MNKRSRKPSPAGILAIGFFSLSSIALGDLVGWWALDGNLKDQSDAQNDGEAIGDPTFEDAAPTAIGDGQSIRFSGEGDGIAFNEDASLDNTEFTFTYFLNPDGAVQNGGFERLSSRGGDSFETALSASNELSYFSPDIGWNTTAIPVLEDNWSHVAWRNRGDEMDLFVDGKLEFTGPAVPDGQPSSFMHIGVRHNVVEGYEGLMDDIALWDEALSDEDINTLSRVGVEGFILPEGQLDTDGDGIADAVEDEIACLDKNTPDADSDADGDGLTNAEEILERSNACEADTDGDGLDDHAELRRVVNGQPAPTNPNSPDTDGDGLTDKVETGSGTFQGVMDTGTDPLRADTDNDRLLDLEEVDRGTNPNNADTDGDTFLDGFEIAVNSDPTSAQSTPVTGIGAWWPLDGSLEDFSGNDLHGVELDAANFEADFPAALGSGESLRFNGETDGVLIEPSDGLDFNIFTLTYYINPEDAVQSGGFERLTSRGSDSFETALSDSNQLSFFAPGIGWNQTGINVEADEWTHVAWRNDGEQVDLFVNGEPEFTGGPAVPEGNPNGLMKLAIRHNDVEGYEGLMDDVALWNGALSDAEIAELAQTGVAAFLGLAEARFQVTAIARNAEGNVTLRWESEPGQLFEIHKTTDLASGEWTLLLSEIPAASEPALETTAQVDTDLESALAFYRVALLPPPALFVEDFESGAEGWSTGVIENFPETETQWERGTPSNGPGAAQSGANAYGTDLDANYLDATGVYLRSPTIDLTGAGRTRLEFWHYLDASPGEGGRLNLRDPDGTLISTINIYDGDSMNTNAWTVESVRLPDLNRPIVVEFELLSGEDQLPDNGAGWFIDDVMVD